MHKLPVLCCAVFLLLYFKNVSIKNSKLINKIAASMFGVYLIHDNSFLKPFLWKNIFKNNVYYTSSYLALHALVVILLVFSVCIVIDQFRLKFIEKPVLKFIDNNWERITISANFFQKKSMDIFTYIYAKLS